MSLSHHQGSRRALFWALALSLVFHAGLLTLKWAAPAAFDRIFEANTLEVVLVNSSSKNPPDSPLALAQVNLAGGGQVPGTGLQTSPFSAPRANANTQELAQLEKQIESLKNEEQREFGRRSSSAGYQRAIQPLRCAKKQCQHARLGAT